MLPGRREEGKKEGKEYDQKKGDRQKDRISNQGLHGIGKVLFLQLDDKYTSAHYIFYIHISHAWNISQ